MYLPWLSGDTKFGGFLSQPCGGKTWIPGAASQVQGNLHRLQPKPQHVLWEALPCLQRGLQMTCLPLERHRSACVSAMHILFSFTGCEFSDKGEFMVGLNRERKP